MGKQTVPTATTQPFRVGFEYLPKLCRPGTCTGTCTEVWPKRSYQVCARPCIKILHRASVPQLSESTEAPGRDCATVGCFDGGKQRGVRRRRGGPLTLLAVAD